jgi:hypothetical protein
MDLKNKLTNYIVLIFFNFQFQNKIIFKFYLIGPFNKMKRCLKRNFSNFRNKTPITQELWEKRIQENLKRNESEAQESPNFLTPKTPKESQQTISVYLIFLNESWNFQKTNNSTINTQIQFEFQILLTFLKSMDKFN